jgi:hypothetical protein
MTAVLTWLSNLAWTSEPEAGQVAYKTKVVLNGQLVAWSAWLDTPDGSMRISMGCDVSHLDLSYIFKRYGGVERVLAAWEWRGWIKARGTQVHFTRQAFVDHPVDFFAYRPAHEC